MIITVAHNSALLKYLDLVCLMDFYHSELAAHHGLGPEEGARERRHLESARLEFRIYAQFQRHGLLGANRGPPLEERLPGPPAG